MRLPVNPWPPIVDLAVLPATERRLGTRSTTTVRGVPARPTNATVLASLRVVVAALSTSGLTCSGGKSISDAAISICSCTSSVNPRAAVTASATVGGSCLTLRGPYFVFQTSLISTPSLLAPLNLSKRFALQYEDYSRRQRHNA